VNLSLSLTNGMGLSSGTDRGVLIANRANTTVTETSDGYRITKSGGSGVAWDADATSAANTAGNFLIRAQARQTNANLMVGANADPALDSNNTSIDYAIWFASDGTIRTSASGATSGSFGAYTTSEYAFLRRIGSVIELLKGATANVADAVVLSDFFGASYSATAFFDSSLVELSAAADVRVTF
jgi:hypothetical protein